MLTCEACGRDMPPEGFVMTAGRLLCADGCQHVAHDSGDGETIAHCPFCGGGNVTGGSDGSAECSFCHTIFTVQVQPQYNAFPQTIDGQPINDPSLPGDPTQAPMPGELPLDADPDLAEEGGATAPGDTDPAVEGAEPKKANPFAKDSLFRTAHGETLPLDSYIRHLALVHADDPGVMLNDLRVEASTRA